MSTEAQNAINESPYLGGIHTPLSAEIDPCYLRCIEGELPLHFKGLFVRNTPNPFFKPIGKYHWFDGDGMVHGIRFINGQAEYSAKYIKTEVLAQEQEAGEALWTGILERPRRRLPVPIKDTANTDLTWHNGQLIASWWLSGLPYALTPELETLGRASFTEALPKGASVAAHPKVDPNTGELIFFGYNLFKKPYYGYGVADAQGMLKHFTFVDTPNAHIQHDIAITQNYTILIDMPLGWDEDALKVGNRKIAFHRDRPSRFGIIPRYGAAEDIIWFEAESAYMYHTIRAFESGDLITLTGCRIVDPIPEEQDQTGDVARLDIIHLVPLLYEWTFNLKTGEVTERLLDKTPTEFPRVNDQTLGTETRYTYNPTIAQAPTLCFNGFIKYDLQNGQQEQLSYESLLGELGWRGGEVCFAPDPQRSESEDGGWVISILTHPNQDRSQLVIIDAQKLTNGFVARCELPVKVPVGFHAEFVSL